MIIKNQVNNRDSFIFYRSFFSASKHLKDNEKAQLFDAICEFALNNNEIEINGIGAGMLDLMKPQLQANRKRFENGCKDKKKSKIEAKQKQNRSKTEANKNVNHDKIKIPDFIDANLWNGFLQMRQGMKAKPTEIAINLIIKKLRAFENKKIGNANLALKNSIENNWKGVFETTSNNDHNKPKSNLSWMNK